MKNNPAPANETLSVPLTPTQKAEAFWMLAYPNSEVVKAIFKNNRELENYASQR